jgi:hypothetical protein
MMNERLDQKTLSTNCHSTGTLNEKHERHQASPDNGRAERFANSLRNSPSGRIPCRRLSLDRG